MPESKNHKQSSVLVVTAVLAFVVPFVIGISPVFDLGELVYFFLVVPVLALILLLRAIVRRSWKWWLVVLVFLAVSTGCFKANCFLRVHGRWLLVARTAKAQVLAQEPPSDGQLRHIDWDGWGMFAQDTEVYLVNDPARSTMAIHKSREGLEAKGVPCKFWRAYRLEPHWYAVVFFTETSWTACTY